MIKRAPTGQRRYRGRNNAASNGRKFNNRSGGSGQNLDRRTRNNAAKAVDKYKAMAKSSSDSGDLVDAEFYYQHAEHYQRIVNACDEALAPPPQAAPSEEEQETAVDTANTDADDSADDAQPQLDVAFLNTSIPTPEDAEPAPAPKRRGRPKKVDVTQEEQVS